MVTLEQVLSLENEWRRKHDTDTKHSLLIFLDRYTLKTKNYFEFFHIFGVLGFWGQTPTTLTQQQ